MIVTVPITVTVIIVSVNCSFVAINVMPKDNRVLIITDCFYWPTVCFPVSMILIHCTSWGISVIFQGWNSKCKTLFITFGREKKIQDYPIYTFGRPAPESSLIQINVIIICPKKHLFNTHCRTVILVHHSLSTPGVAWRHVCYSIISTNWVVVLFTLAVRITLANGRWW